MKYIYLLPLLPMISLASEADAPAREAEQQANAQETELQENAPVAENLRSRELGEAFRNFQPSEEITADNAVSFPVDI